MSEQSEKQVAHSVEYLTGREVARIDADPVLDRSDYWRGETA